MTTIDLLSVELLTDKELLAEANTIIDLFRDYSASDPWGWDWPTMRMIFPAQTSRYRDVAHEWDVRHPKENADAR